MLLAYKTCSLIADRPKVETEFLRQEIPAVGDRVLAKKRAYTSGSYNKIIIADCSSEYALFC